MAAPDSSDRQLESKRFEIVLGEVLFASTLATVMFTNQVAAGQLSHDQAAILLDNATLVLERHRGAMPDAASATDYALNRLNALMELLYQLRR